LPHISQLDRLRCSVLLKQAHQGLELSKLLYGHLAGLLCLVRWRRLLRCLLWRLCWWLLLLCVLCWWRRLLQPPGFRLGLLPVRGLLWLLRLLLCLQQLLLRQQ